MIKAQQVIILLPLFKVSFPSNSGFLFAFLMQIAAFEWITISEPVSDLFGLPQIETQRRGFRLIGMHQVWFLMSIGPLLIVILAWPILLLVYYALDTL